MKTKEELNALKAEVETVSRKLHELTDEELAQVSGGVYQGACFVYVVEKGDTISSIAVKFNTTVKILVELNNVRNPNLIYAGNKLLIPCKE